MASFPRNIIIRLTVSAICLLAIGGVVLRMCSGQTRSANPVPHPASQPAPSGFWISIFPWGQQIYHIQADAANPNIFYATTNLGLFRSLNAGMTWEALWLLQARLTHATLAQSVRAPAVMYLGIAVGQQGAVLRSTDAGGSWAQIGAEDIKRAVEDVQVDSDSPDTVYAVSDSSDGSFICTGCVLYKSMNGGRTWGNVAPDARSSNALTSGIQFVTVDRQRPGHLFVNGNAASSGNERDLSNLWESTDGGLSWQHRKSTVVHVISSRGYKGVACNWKLFVLHPNDNSLIAGTADGNGWGGNHPVLCLSRDGGTSWQDIKIVDNEPYPESRALESFAWSLTAAGTIYAGTEESLYKSSQYGQNWQRVLPYRTSGLLAAQSGDLYAVTSLGLLKSKNGGGRWHFAGFGLPTGPGANGCTLQAIAGGQIYVGCQGGFWTTGDEGLSWQWFAIGADPAPEVSAKTIPARHGQDVRNLLVAQDKTLYLNLISEGEGRVLQVRPDGKAVNIDLRGQAPNWLDFSPTDSKTLYLTASGGFASWRNPLGGLSLMKSDDGGFSWQTFNLARWARPKLAAFSLTGVPLLAVAPQSSKVAYAVATFTDRRTGQSDLAVEKTVDGGVSWRDIFSDPALGLRFQRGQLGSITSVVADPTNLDTVYLVFSSALFRSPGGSSQWVELPFKNNEIRSFAVSAGMPTMLYVAADNGVWSSGDGGTRWSLLPVGFYQQKAQKLLSTGPVTLVQGENGIYRLTGGDLSWIAQRWKTLEDDPEADPIGIATGH